MQTNQPPMSHIPNQATSAHPTKYTVGRGDRIVGEFTDQDIILKLESKELIPSDLVYTEGFDNWKYVSDVFQTSPSLRSETINVSTAVKQPLLSRPVLIGMGAVGLIIVIILGIVGIMRTISPHKIEVTPPSEMVKKKIRQQPLMAKTSPNLTGINSNARRSKPRAPASNPTHTGTRKDFKIKGLYLGMHIGDAITVLNKVDPDLSFFFDNPNKKVKSDPDNDIQGTVDTLMALNAALSGNVKMKQSDLPDVNRYAKSRNGQIAIGADDKNRVIYILIKGDEVNKLFGTQRMDERRFLQTFVKAYNIVGLTPIRRNVTDNFENQYGYQTVYKHFDDSGYEIRIYSKFIGDEQKLQNYTATSRLMGLNNIDIKYQPERTLELIKRKSASEALNEFSRDETPSNNAAKDSLSVDDFVNPDGTPKVSKSNAHSTPKNPIVQSQKGGTSDKGQETESTTKSYVYEKGRLYREGNHIPFTGKITHIFDKGIGSIEISVDYGELLGDTIVRYPNGKPYAIFNFSKRARANIESFKVDWIFFNNGGGSTLYYENGQECFKFEEDASGKFKGIGWNKNGKKLLQMEQKKRNEKNEEWLFQTWHDSGREKWAWGKLADQKRGFIKVWDEEGKETHFTFENEREFRRQAALSGMSGRFVSQLLAKQHKEAVEIGSRWDAKFTMLQPKIYLEVEDLFRWE